MKKTVVALTLFLAFSGFCEVFSPTLLKDGDLIFQETSSQQSKAIKLATHSKYTHVGIIFKYDGEYKVLEAVQPVKITTLESFIKRSVKNHFVIKRLKNNSMLTEENILKMKRKGKSYLGKDYDLTFEWSDTKIYCSELVWKIYKDSLGIEIGKTEKLKQFDLKHDLVKSIMNKRYGDKIPYNEPVISPKSVFNSNLLKTVYKNS